MKPRTGQSLLLSRRKAQTTAALLRALKSRRQRAKLRKVLAA